MIHHLSIAARDPKQAAGVLADLMGGTAVPFPPNPGSFFALQLDDHGSGVEVYPAGTELQPGGAVGGSFVKTDARSYGPTHFALSVSTDAETVQAIAQRAGWQCFDCNRGPFHVIEVWVEIKQWSRSCHPNMRGIPLLHPSRQHKGSDGGGEPPRPRASVRGRRSGAAEHNSAASQPVLRARDVMRSF